MHTHTPDESELKEHTRDTVLCAVGLILGFFTGLIDAIPEVVSVVFYAFAMLAGGRDAAVDAWDLLKRGVLDIHFLMLAVAVGAASVGAWGEGALLLFLFCLSGTLEAFAELRTHKEIRALFKSSPKIATRIHADGSEETVEVEALKLDDLVSIKPGDLCPVDALLIQGQTEVDESALTGEALPVEKAVGDELFAGTLNLWGSVQAKVVRLSRDSAIQKIIRLVEEARNSKAKAQRFTDKFGTRYTWLILGSALAVFVFWTALLGIPAFENTEVHGFSAFYRAMTFLVVASPCALVLSIPSAILAAIAAGAKQGILFKSGSAIEKLAEIDTVCLDKTGTLTTGELQVVSIESFPPHREIDLLTLAASLEKHSAHPLARAINRHAVTEKCVIKPVQDFRSHNGLGLSGNIDGQACSLGRRDWLIAQGNHQAMNEVPFPAAGHTEVWVIAGDLYGRLLLKDGIRKESAPVIEQLQAWGLRPIMLTGDREESALSVAEVIGLKREDIFAGLKPEDKVAVIREQERLGKRVAMVGDGVNDAPCLAAAYIAVGMGARGSDAALEESEIVLMEDKIEKFLDAFILSKRAGRIIRQNLVISLGTIVVMIVAALGGYIPLTFGVLAHEGSTVVVCLNSLRLFYKNHSKV